MVYLLYSIFLVPKRQTEAMTSWYYLINWCIETLLCSHVLKNIHWNAMTVVKIAETIKNEETILKHRQCKTKV
jgi:hypothetical protein